MRGKKLLVKRDGTKQLIDFEKLSIRVSKISASINKEFIEPILLARKVIVGIYDNITSIDLDELIAETAAGQNTTHPDYARLAACISSSKLNKNTMLSFAKTCQILVSHVFPKNEAEVCLIAQDVFKIVSVSAKQLDSVIYRDSNNHYDYFGFRTLERSYLLKLNNRIVERPQHLLMRVSVGIHKQDLDLAMITYHLMLRRFFTHSSPTLFNGGTPRPQLSSCFLICMKSDSIEGIYDTLKECAVISKCAGGIGLSIHCIRAGGTTIHGTNGNSNGLCPMLRVFNDTARYVDQGGGKRKGAFAIYLEPWHGDIFDWLCLRKNHGKEELRARDLFYGLWINNLFMKRVEKILNGHFFVPLWPQIYQTLGVKILRLFTLDMRSQVSAK